jgi:hypothetical protein
MKIALACLALALVCCAPVASMAQSAPKDGETTESWQINVDRDVACKRREDAENLIHFIPTDDLPTGGPTMFARIGVMMALNRGQVREFNPDRKDHHWGKRKLARDR